MLLGIIVGVLAMSWGWITERLNSGTLAPGLTAGPTTAQAAFNQGDLDTAVERARAKLNAEPDDAAALAVLVRALIYRSYADLGQDADRAAALEISTQAAAANPYHEDIQAVHAFALQANGQPVTAAEVAEAVLDRDPDHALARMALALAYSGVGSHNIALRESQQAVQAPGWRLDTERALALSYSGVGDYANALAAVDRAIGLNSHLLMLYFEKASYARQIGNADAATVAYFQVMAYDPGNIKARLRLCQLSSTLRERESAVRYCRQVTELAPQYAEGWYQLGYEYFLQGDFRAAQSSFNRCTTLQVAQDVPVDERRFECWYLQGQSAEILGDCDALLPIYNEYRQMVLYGGLNQTWLYPPEGPPACVTPAN